MSLKELIEAKNTYKDVSNLFIDNDEVFFEDENESIISIGTPKNLLEEALDLLGIKWEYV